MAHFGHFSKIQHFGKNLVFKQTAIDIVAKISGDSSKHYWILLIIHKTKIQTCFQPE